MNRAWLHYGIQFRRSLSSVISSALLTLASQSLSLIHSFSTLWTLNTKSWCFRGIRRESSSDPEPYLRAGRAFPPDACPAVHPFLELLTALLWTPGTSSTHRRRPHLLLARQAKLVLELSAQAHSGPCSILTCNTFLLSSPQYPGICAEEGEGKL